MEGSATAVVLVDRRICERRSRRLIEDRAFPWVTGGLTPLTAESRAGQLAMAREVSAFRVLPHNHSSCAFLRESQSCADAENTQFITRAVRQ